MSIIFAILAFGLIILIHELGHFVAAKLSGVLVLEFSIGMGPKLFSFKKGETDYSIRIFPIGGFVQMYGESEGDEVDIDDKRALSNKSPLIRFIVFFAGAFMNLVLAVFIFTMITMNFGYTTTLIDDVVKDSPAYEAGIEKGDTLLRLNGKKLLTPDDLTMGIAMEKGAPVTIEYKKNNGEIKEEIIKPEKNEDGLYLIGIYSHKVENPTITESLTNGFKELIGMIGQTFTSFKMLITGEVNFKTDVGGPVTIIKMAGEAAKVGVWNLLNLTAFLSVQIGIFNLIPFPALDGGHIFAVLIEGITGKKIPSKVLNAINTVGFMLLMGLMAIVLLKDILFPVNI
ncbi:MAG: RIP metalloprotease RseP [Sarcina sp.]